MASVKIFSLGGLGENGKNLYVCEVDSKIFIMDCGIKYPSVELYGVDTIIPDFTYLIENKDRIEGVFLTHGHEDHIGGLAYLLKEINVPVYGSDFTMTILEDTLSEVEDLDCTKLMLYRVNESKKLKFGSVQVSFYATTHSIPESLGIVIHTKDGCIVYTGDYTFDQTGDNKYKTNFLALADVAREGVLCLLSESVGASNFANASANFELIHRLNNIFSNAKGRIICSLFSSDLKRIQQVIDMSIRHNKRIAIIGRKTQRIVDIAVKRGFLRIPKDTLINLRYIDDKNKNRIDDLVVLVTGIRHEPFFMLQRMCKHIDRLIHVDETDTIVMMTSPVPGTEKMAARTLDFIYRCNTAVSVFDKKLLQASHASSEEIKMLVNILNPSYFIPVKGEYRQQYAQAKVIKELGVLDKNIILLDNGNVVEFKDGELMGVVGEVKCGEVLIDGAIVGDVNDIVLRDRELLANDGVIMIIANVNPKTKKIVAGPEVVSKGFLYVKDSEEITNSIKEIFNSIAEKQFKGKYINWVDFKANVKQDVNKYLYKELKRTPITIPVIVSVDVN